VPSHRYRFPITLNRTLSDAAPRAGRRAESGVHGGGIRADAVPSHRVRHRAAAGTLLERCVCLPFTWVPMAQRGLRSRAYAAANVALGRRQRRCTLRHPRADPWPSIQATASPVVAPPAVVGSDRPRRAMGYGGCFGREGFLGRGCGGSIGCWQAIRCSARTVPRSASTCVAGAWWLPTPRETRLAGCAAIPVGRRCCCRGRAARCVCRRRCTRRPRLT
jgi:hypothetical protein